MSFSINLKITERTKLINTEPIYTKYIPILYDFSFLTSNVNIQDNNTKNIKKI